MGDSIANDPLRVVSLTPSEQFTLQRAIKEYKEIDKKVTADPPGAALALKGKPLHTNLSKDQNHWDIYA